jgi:hypothetical protein
VIAFQEIEKLMTMKETADKTRMFRSLLKGQALSYFEHQLMRRMEGEDSDIPDNEIKDLVLRNVGLEYIPKCAMCMSRMFRSLLKGQALSYFEHYFMRRMEVEDSVIPENELIKLVLRDVGL